MPSLSIVIPAYNEEASIATVVTESLAVLRECVSDYEVVVINDASGDATGAMTEDLGQRYPGRVRVIHHRQRLGMAKTFEDAYAAGRKDYVWLVHGDRQYPPSLLRVFVHLLGQEDLILLVRRKKYYGSYRHLLSFAYRVIPHLLFGVDLVDSGCSKCMRRELIMKIPTTSSGIFVEAERAIRAAKRGYRMRLFPVDIQQRTNGKAQGGDLLSACEVLRDVLFLWLQCVLLRREW